MTPGQWVSFATLSPDASDAWSPVVTVNLDPGGWVNVFHVPVPGAQVTEIANSPSVPDADVGPAEDPHRFRRENGFIEVFQDGVLVTRARVSGGHGRLEQAHFGMYAIASLTKGVLCNDNLRITAARS